MIPFFSKEALNICYNSIVDENIQLGWGLDYIWAAKLLTDAEPKKLAVFDSIVIKHTKPVGQKYPKGIDGHIFVSWLHPFKEHRLVVIGSEAMITFEETYAAGVGTGAITEAGIFNDPTTGTMLARTVFATVNKGAADVMTISWDVTIS